MLDVENISVVSHLTVPSFSCMSTKESAFHLSQRFAVSKGVKRLVSVEVIHAGSCIDRSDMHERYDDLDLASNRHWHQSAYLADISSSPLFVSPHFHKVLFDFRQPTVHLIIPLNCPSSYPEQLSLQIFQSPKLLYNIDLPKLYISPFQSSQFPHPRSIMDAFTQQMMIMNLNAQANQAMAQMMMRSSLPYSTTPAWVAPVSYSSHHGGNPHAHTVHPGPQQYGLYSPQSVAPQGRALASHHHQYLPSQPHNSGKPHPKAVTWDAAVKVASATTKPRSHGKDGGRDISHNPPKPRREVDDGTWSTTAQKAHSVSKHGTHRISSHKGGSDAWSTTAQKAPGVSKHGAHRISRHKVASDAWSTTAQKG